MVSNSEIQDVVKFISNWSSLQNGVAGPSFPSNNFHIDDTYSNDRLINSMFVRNQIKEPIFE